MICSVVRSLRTVICVNRPKRNCSCPACSNQDLALSECICRLHRSASQTLASRKFNVFIDLLIRQVYLWSVGNNQTKFDPLWPRPLCLQDHFFADPTTCGELWFSPIIPSYFLLARREKTRLSRRVTSVSSSGFRSRYPFTRHASDDIFEILRTGGKGMVLVGDRTPPLSCLRPPTVPKAANVPVFPLTNLI